MSDERRKKGMTFIPVSADWEPSSDPTETSLVYKVREYQVQLTQKDLPDVLQEILARIDRLTERIEHMEMQLKTLPEFRVKEGPLDIPQDLSIQSAKTQVTEFLAEHYAIDDMVYPSDIAEALNLDYNLVLQIFSELMKEKRLE